MLGGDSNWGYCVCSEGGGTEAQRAEYEPAAGADGAQRSAPGGSPPEFPQATCSKDSRPELHVRGEQRSPPETLVMAGVVGGPLLTVRSGVGVWTGEGLARTLGDWTLGRESQTPCV